MEQDFVSAAMRFFGHFTRNRQMRQHRNREREGKRNDRIGQGTVIAHVVDYDRETCACGPASIAWVQGSNNFGYWNDHVNRMGPNSVQSVVEARSARRRHRL